MKIYIDPSDGMLEPLGERKTSLLAEEPDRARQFLQLIRDYEALRRGDAERAQEKRVEAKEAQQKRVRERRISELLSLVSYLRQKMVSHGYDRRIASQLSMAQTELFWLMFAV